MVKSYAEQLEENNKYVAEASEGGVKAQARAAAGDAVDYVAAEARKAASDPQAYFQNAKNSVVDFTRSQPLTALGFAALAGYVYGSLRAIVRR
jgi:ElaB/YqjD/DUF883 family membrane-anchored ribosome-binding protein